MPSADNDSEQTRVDQIDQTRCRVQLTMEITRFHLPPVESALAIGRRAGIGPRAMEKALAEMVPGAFVLVPIEHPVIEAVLLRSSHLRRIPQERLVPIILRNCDGLMDETEMLHFDLSVRVHKTEELEV